MPTRQLPRARLAAQVLGLLLVSALAACGGGGGGGGGSGSSGGGRHFSVSGRVQKGPFTIGSAIAVNELNAGLGPNGTVYNVQTSDAVGDFSVPTLVSTQQVEIVAQGFYYDELSARLSASQIQLRAIADLSIDPSPTVNVLTTLQEQRLKTLVGQGLSFSAAYTQSQSEVLALFGIDASKVDGLSTLYSMKINGGSDADAVLLAASVILSQIASDKAKANGTSQAAELSNLVNTIAAQIAGSGTLSGTDFSSAKSQAAPEIDPAAVTNALQAYYSQNGASVTVPAFVEWVDQSNSGILPQRLVPVSGLAFIDVPSAAPAQQVTSNAVTVSGLGSGVAAPVVLSAGAAAVLVKNNTLVSGRFAQVQDGDSLALQVTVPGYSVSTSSSLTAGSSSAGWTVTGAPLSGSISGLSGSGLTLAINGSSLAVASGSTSFTYTSAIPNGTSYSVTVQTQPGTPLQACAVSNGSGTAGPTPSSISIACTDQSALLLLAGYDTQRSTGVLYTLTIDSITGALTPANGFEKLTPEDLEHVKPHPNGKFAYADGLEKPGSSTVDGQFFEYAVDTATGALTLQEQLGIPAASFLNLTPSGSFLYVASFNGVGGSNSSNYAYAVDATSGALTPVSGSPFPTDYIYALTSGGSFAYGVGVNGSTIQTEIIDPSSGALSNGSSIAPQQQEGCQIVAHPNGQFLYDVEGSIAEGFLINQTDGSLSSLAGSPYSITANPGVVACYQLTFDATGQYVYVLGDFSLATYAVDQTSGALTAVAGASVSTGANHAAAVLDPSGHYIYVAQFTVNNNSGTTITVVGYSIDPQTHALTPFPGNPLITLGGIVESMAVLPVH